MKPTLFEILQNSNKKNTDSGDNLSGDFSLKLNKYVSIIVDNYIKRKIDLNKTIASIAQKENLNDEQITRIIESVNNQVYLYEYNQMKSSPEREVKFNIASLQEIKNIYKNGEVHKPINERSASSNADGLEKTASWENEEGDSLNFLNYSPYETTGLCEDKKTDNKNYIIKLASKKLESCESDINRMITKVAGDIYTISEALIKYDMLGADSNEIFNQICKKANLEEREQKLIQDSVIQKIAQFKEYGKLPTEYTLELNFENIEKVADRYSLKQYSFMEKIAQDTQSNQKVPVVVTDKGVIKDVNKLIDIAANAKGDINSLDIKTKELDNIKKKLKVGDNCEQGNDCSNK